jgi:hypothetical protein
MKQLKVNHQYPSHFNDFIKNEAITKNIELIFVPVGLTYKYQPLDVLINGILKKKGKTLWRKELIKNPDLKIINSEAVKHFLTAKDEITSETIIKSFNKSCFVPNVL